MSEPQSRAPGRVDATRDDHTDMAIERMLDKPKIALEVMEAVARGEGNRLDIIWKACDLIGKPRFPSIK